MAQEGKEEILNNLREKASQYISRANFFAELEKRHSIEFQAKYQEATVGIAGLGGLGSHIAFSLARLGIGKLILADFDTVDASNLHRQQYSVYDLGLAKTEALARQLVQINPYIELERYNVRLTQENIPKIFEKCDIICEAFDSATEKALLTECVLTEMNTKFLIGASGMAGTHSPNSMEVRKVMKRYYLCGDGIHGLENNTTLFAPRVALCAAQQASMVMRLLIDQDI